MKLFVQFEKELAAEFRDKLSKVANFLMAQMVTFLVIMED